MKATRQTRAKSLERTVALAKQVQRLFMSEHNDNVGFALGMLVADFVARHRCDIEEDQLNLQRSTLEMHVELVMKLLPEFNVRVALEPEQQTAPTTGTKQ